jgi:hypothetical protein
MPVRITVAIKLDGRMVNSHEKFLKIFFWITNEQKKAVMR